MATIMPPNSTREPNDVTKGKKWKEAVKDFALSTGLDENKVFHSNGGRPEKQTPKNFGVLKGRR